jgi:quercetin dioxygenase-like cupin family protein
MPYRLRLTRQRPGSRATSLRPMNRVLYVLEGEITVASGGAELRLGADSAWHGSAGCELRAAAPEAAVLCCELAGGAGRGVDDGVGQELVSEHPIDLSPGGEYLMRCDRVYFAPRGVALPHRHRGGGIRYLIEGELTVRVGDRPPRTMKPGDAWFESGVEPVYAEAAPLPTSFVRVSILPRSIRGLSSIMYVDPADAERGKPRRYRVYLDDPIETEEA